ncbi:unnamed protein product [Trichobilharzia szidati]|nr:unnamed protein product [Trichobilharzia szidati]
MVLSRYSMDDDDNSCDLHFINQNMCYLPILYGLYLCEIYYFVSQSYSIDSYYGCGKNSAAVSDCSYTTWNNGFNVVCIRGCFIWTR